MSSVGSCGNCEFARQSVSVAGTETKVTLTDEGSIIYANISQCGVGMSKIGTDEMESEYPDLLKRLSECKGPVKETTEIPRIWPLGSLGFVKQATVQRCGATNESELLRVVSESRARVGMQ